MQVSTTVVSQGLASTIEPTIPVGTPNHPVIVICADPVAASVDPRAVLVVVAVRDEELSVSRLELSLDDTVVVEISLI